LLSVGKKKNLLESLSLMNLTLEQKEFVEKGEGAQQEKPQFLAY
jgi:hypothetical protein